MDIESIYHLFLRSTGICTDTRKVEKGKLFVALKGPNFNANEFAAQALEAGCIGVVVDEEKYCTNERYILVDDGLETLQKLANHHRKALKDITVLGITGSNGKTTTKELIHAVLVESHSVYATRGNLNNHIGVPLTLLELTPEHRIAIIEMGASKRGDIEELCEIAEPDLGMITNIGEAHLEGMGGLEGVLKTKTELYEHLWAKGGKVFVNANSEKLMNASNGMERSTYGIDNGDLTGSKAGTGKTLRIKWTGTDTVSTKLFGDHNMTNALAAVCIGKHFNTPDKAMAAALEAYSPDNNRSQWEESSHNSLIMDAYNANPTSVKAALSSLAGMQTDREKLVILGDMFEMGESAVRVHHEVVETINSLELDAILVGPLYCEAAAGIRAFKTTEEAIKALSANPIRNRCILVKGSRGMKLESLYELL